MNPISGDNDGGPSGAIQEEALAWFASLQDTGLDPKQQAAFDDWLAADPHHAEAYAKVLVLWRAPAFETALGRYADEALAAAMKQRRSRWRAPSWAAAAALFCALAWGLTTFGWLDRWHADYATVAGEQRRILLSDGSAVTLNTDSALKLDFSENRRGVRLLSGEAYFEVQPDSARPFVVTTGTARVRVIGTRFSVSTGAETAVAVESGIVACANEQGDSVQLTHGQQVSVSKRRITSPEPVDAGRAFAWLKGRLIFKDQPLVQVLEELDRYHPGTIFVTDNRLAQIPVTGNYKLDDTAAVIRALAEVTGGHITHISNYLTIVR
ncbi:FecR family protein [Methylococcus sp. EFPC2]|uniref:FecR family protein n=1 Tax=Methylococcus sp. EFPC2 TaxID=2812648 RepID=UPI0019670F86|nr:FecR family protein [Methylococcus sp. EFPC2]QSA96001.1 FecR family protein [Methylococcus sp. EFPC2]